MTWTTPATFTDGQLVDEGDLTLMQDNLVALRTVQTAVVDTTGSAVALSASWQDAAEVTIPADEPAAGSVYDIEWFATLVQDSGGARTIELRVQLGTTALYASSDSIGASATGRSVHVRCRIHFTGTAAQDTVGILTVGDAEAGWQGAVDVPVRVGVAAATEDSTSALDVALQVKSDAATATQTLTVDTVQLNRVAVID